MTIQSICHAPSPEAFSVLSANGPQFFAANVDLDRRAVPDRFGIDSTSSVKRRLSATNRLLSSSNNIRIDLSHSFIFRSAEPLGATPPSAANKFMRARIVRLVVPQMHTVDRKRHCSLEDGITKKRFIRVAKLSSDNYSPLCFSRKMRFICARNRC